MEEEAGKNIEIINFITESLKESKDFIVDQAPDVVQQFLGATQLDSLVAFVTALLIAKMIYDIYEGNEKIDGVGWCLIGFFVLQVVFDVWSIFR